MFLGNTEDKRALCFTHLVGGHFINSFTWNFLLRALNRFSVGFFCAAVGQPGGVYQPLHHEVVLPVLPGQSEYTSSLIKLPL